MQAKKQNKAPPGVRKPPWLLPAICSAGGILAYLVLRFAVPADSLVSEDGYIERGGYGTEAVEAQLYVDGLFLDEEEITVNVSGRVYTAGAAHNAFYEAMEALPDRMRGDNASLSEVRTDLNLPSRLKEKGIRVRWSSSMPEVLASDGKLETEVSEPTEISLTAELSAFVMADEEKPDGTTKLLRESFLLPVIVLPPQKTSEEAMLSRFSDFLKKEDAAQSGESYFALPAEFEGRSLRFFSREASGFEPVVLFGILLGVLFWLRDKENEKKASKERALCLMLDYPQILSRFVILTGAGLATRNAWERIVSDYEKQRDAGGKKRWGYEEMAYTAWRMKNGVSEAEAMREFGRRTALRQYMKFAGILEQNVRSGTKNLRGVLSGELSEALEERKNLARKQGEEASTKLLLPLFLMLGIVMVIIMVPAMMGM